VEIVPPAGYVAAPTEIFRNVICDQASTANFALVEATSLSVDPALGIYGGSVSLRAVLTAAAAPLPGAVKFSLNTVQVGSGTTIPMALHAQ